VQAVLMMPVPPMKRTFMNYLYQKWKFEGGVELTPPGMPQRVKMNHLRAHCTRPLTGSPECHSAARICP
jgi:hypothetical protein